MTTHDETRDETLRAALRAADPAALLPELPAGTRAALLERASSGTARPAPRARVRPLLIGGAGLLALAAAATALVVLPRPDAAPAGPVLALSQPASDPSAICAPLDAFAEQALRGAEVALSGTVVSTSGGVVEIRPDRFYRGGPASAVRVRADDGGGAALDGAVLRDGEHVLLAATGGRVATCGLSAAASPDLQRYYDAAF